jgi:hypothetical protein
LLCSVKVIFFSLHLKQITCIVKNLLTKPVWKWSSLSGQYRQKIICRKVSFFLLHFADALQSLQSSGKVPKTSALRCDKVGKLCQLKLLGRDAHRTCHPTHIFDQEQLFPSTVSHYCSQLSRSTGPVCQDDIAVCFAINTSYILYSRREPWWPSGLVS